MLAAGRKLKQPKDPAGEASGGAVVTERLSIREKRFPEKSEM